MRRYDDIIQSEGGSVVIIDRRVESNPIAGADRRRWHRSPVRITRYHPPALTKPPEKKSKQIWSANVNTCPDWQAGDSCMLSLKDEYLRHSCRVCSLASECWPGIQEGSVHSMQSGQSAARQLKKGSWAGFFTRLALNLR
jgi:hypothetical protein